MNWDTQLQTVGGRRRDLHRDDQGRLLDVPVSGEGQPDEFIRFSTTRPETMLGDTAVAVHPDDERYKHLIGKTVTIPLVNRDIPIIADGHAGRPEARHRLREGDAGPRPQRLRLRPAAQAADDQHPQPRRHDQRERRQVRRAWTATRPASTWPRTWRSSACSRAARTATSPLKHSDRSKTPIEPYLSDQWFVKMGDRDGKPGLAQTAMDAVTDGRVKFFPERYAKTYLDWLGEKRDWCISRQLWWGHRIPIWYAQLPRGGAEDRRFADRDDVAWRLRRGERPVADRARLDGPAGRRRWARSIALDAGPRRARHLVQLRALAALDARLAGARRRSWRYYYPTSVLVTSRDIITLWVARMVITGLYNVGEVPFHHVYIHPKILDGFGETMSKTKGNGIDPLDIIDRYGTDALRFGMVHLATETQDSRMPVANVCPHCDTLVPVKQEHMYMRTRKVTCPSCKKPFRPGGPWPADDPELPTAKQASERFEMGRNFANKLWNAARFLLMNLEGYTPGAAATWRSCRSRTAGS